MNKVSIKISILLVCFITISTTVISCDILELKNETDTPVYKLGKLLYADDFENNTSSWFAEIEIPEKSSMTILDGKLDLVAKRGFTAWFKNKLSGNYVISYDAELIDQGGPSDRVSDLNLFWMATDPKGGFFNLDGKFPSYDLLHLYYAGIGGNENSTTRFRKYTGKQGDKDVIQEYTDSTHLLKGNMNYHIRVVYVNGRSMLYVNDVLYFNHLDEEPYQEGYFGFRTTRSHIRFDNFKVYQIKKVIK